MSYSLTISHKAVLSQFSHKPVATGNATEDAADAATLDDLDDDLGEEDAMENADEEGDDDEIEPSVAESDATIVDEVAAEAEEEADVPVLSRAELNLGKFAVTKVCRISLE
jgi:hypothetical protein